MNLFAGYKTDMKMKQEVLWSLGGSVGSAVLILTRGKMRGRLHIFCGYFYVFMSLLQVSYYCCCALDCSIGDAEYFLILQESNICCLDINCYMGDAAFFLSL